MELQSHKISFSLSHPQLKLLRALFCSTVELKLKLELELRKSRRSSFSSDGGISKLETSGKGERIKKWFKRFKNLTME